jgi:prepilin peptidase CpaA
MDLIPLILLAPVLIAVAYFDLRYMRIPNALALIAIALFLAMTPFLAWPEVGIRLLAAATTLVIGFALFAMGLFGGGDAKMMAALMLFVPSQTLVLFGYGFSFAMIAGIALILLLRAMPVLAGSTWVSLQQRGTFPMGISIAMAGLLHPVVITSLN